MDTRIDDSIATCSGTPHTLVTPTTKEVVMDAVQSSARVLQNTRHFIRTDRDGNNPGDTPHTVTSPRSNSPFLIGGIGVSLASENSGSLQVFNKQQYTISEKLGIPKNTTLPLI